MASSGEVPPWGELLGPLAPSAAYSQQYTQGVTSGQRQHSQVNTPSRTPSSTDDGITRDRRDHPSTGKGVEQADQLKTSSQRTRTWGSDEWQEALRNNLVDETRMRRLWEEGFTGRAALKLLTQEAVAQIIARHGGCEQVPVAQVLALNSLVTSRDNIPACALPNNAGTGGTPLGLGDNQPFPSFPGADPYRNVCAIGNGRIQDFQDPTLMMRLQVKRVSYHDITDFVPGHVVEKERLPLAGSMGQLVLETGPKKPPLHKVTLSQWNCANTSILDTLIQEGSITGRNISDYLAYTQKVNRMFDRFEWETVLLFDREYRQLQAVVGMRWGIDVRHLSDIHLRDKSTNSPQAGRWRNGRAGAKHKGNPTDKAGKEVCLSFNKGNCTFHSCKFAHSCSKCGEDHPASSHEAGNGQQH